MFSVLIHCYVLMFTHLCFFLYSLYTRVCKMSSDFDRKITQMYNCVFV
nr:MAG TPA: hypothetical protein [Caudoviricetes sp.]